MYGKRYRYLYRCRHLDSKGREVAELWKGSDETVLKSRNGYYWRKLQEGRYGSNYKTGEVGMY